MSVGIDDNLTVFVTDEKDEALIKNFIHENLMFVYDKFKIRTIAAFPVNEGGKILYSKLQEMV